MVARFDVIEKPTVIKAMYHDGSRESAEAIIEWLTSNDGTKSSIVESSVPSSTDPKKDVHLQFVCEGNVSVLGRQLIFKDWWVVENPYGGFNSMSAREFKERYEVRY